MFTPINAIKFTKKRLTDNSISVDSGYGFTQRRTAVTISEVDKESALNPST